MSYEEGIIGCSAHTRKLRHRHKLLQSALVAETHQLYWYRQDGRVVLIITYTSLNYAYAWGVVMAIHKTITFILFAVYVGRLIEQKTQDLQSEDLDLNPDCHLAGFLYPLWATWSLDLVCSSTHGDNNIVMGFLGITCSLDI